MVTDKNFWSFHQCLPGKMEYGEWLFADTSLKRLKRKVMFEKIPLGKEDFIFVRWNVYHMIGNQVSPLPEGAFYNVKVYRVWSCNLTEDEASEMSVWRKDLKKDAYAVRERSIKKRVRVKMAREVFHICYNTNKERNELIRKIQFERPASLASISEDTISFSLYSLFDNASDLKTEDPFKFMLMVHNTTFETIEIHDNKVVTSVYKYSYEDLAELFKWVMRGL